VRVSNVVGSFDEFPNVTTVPSGDTRPSADARLEPPTDSRMRSNGSPSGFERQHHVVRPELRKALPALGAADDRGHLRVERVRQLHREAPDAAGGAGDGDATTLERIAEGPRAHRREPRDRERRRRLERDLVRDRGQMARAHVDPFGPPAAMHPRDHAGAGGGLEPSSAGSAITPATAHPGRHPSSAVSKAVHSPRFSEQARTSTTAMPSAGEGSSTSRSSMPPGAPEAATSARIR
jgi:hypothetical protein